MISTDPSGLDPAQLATKVHEDVAVRETMKGMATVRKPSLRLFATRGSITSVATPVGVTILKTSPSFDSGRSPVIQALDSSAELNVCGVFQSP